jgi:hypothetical protein
MKELYIKWAKKTAIKALKTAAQTAVSMITIGQAVTDINWQSVLSISLVAGLYSVLTSLASLPKNEKELEQFTRDDDDRSDDAPVELDPVSDDKGDDK